MLYVGIDNGLNGGIVIVNGETKTILSKFVMPVFKGKKTDYDIKSICEILEFLNPDDVRIVLEKAHVRPISGKRASFMTGFGYGVMQGILEAKSLSYSIVSPKDWQQEILKGMNTGDTKKDSIMFCSRRYPKEDWRATERSKKLHDGLTDACCMALYCEKIFN